MCDTIVRVDPGRVLFAKNSDRDPNEAQFPEWHPAKDHPKGTPVRCTWIEIPQVEHTHAVLISRPFWMWGAEIGSNEHHVTIGNEAVFTREPYAAAGLTGMDLLRLALERSESARQAVDVILDLLERHGQGGGCGHENRRFTYHNSFIVADHRGAFVVETAGKKWAVESVSGARTLSNGLTIPGFADRYSDRIRSRVARCRIRQSRTQSLADRAWTSHDLMQTLRDHGQDILDPSYSMLTGAMAGPCLHAGGIVAASQTTASWVAELKADGASHWITATAAPCTGLFKPVDVLNPIDIGVGPTDRWSESLWWRHERFHRRVIQNPAAYRFVFEAERDETERKWLALPPDPAAAFREANLLLNRWESLAALHREPDIRPLPVRRYWNTRNRRADDGPRCKVQWARGIDV